MHEVPVSRSERRPDPRGVVRRAAAAEALGTALLLWVIVGSGILFSSDGPLLAQLIPHAIAIGLALTAIIITLGPVSGAHLNPVVTLAAVLLGHLPRSRAPAYVAAQLVGATLGTLLANVTAGLPVITVAARARDGSTLLVSEIIATLLLVVLIFLLFQAGRSARTIGLAVGGYIAAAIVLMPSTAFANPAVTIGRTLSDTFTGITPASVPAFVAAQVIGALAAVALVRRIGGPTPH